MADAAQGRELHDLLARSIGPACHELRGPLAAAYGFARMLEASDGLDDTGTRYVHQVVHGCERLDDMLDALARIGRIAAGRIHPDRGHVNVGESVASATSAFGAAVSVSVPDSVVADVDREWLVDSIGRIVTALRYDESLHAACSVQHSHDEVTIAVRVHGELPPVDTEVGSSSLGVALARMQLRAMGGELHDVDGGVDIVLPRP